MKNNTLYLVWFAFVCSLILPIVSSVWYIKYHFIGSLIAIIVNVICIPIILICLIKEIQKCKDLTEEVDNENNPNQN